MIIFNFVSFILLQYISLYIFIPLSVLIKYGEEKKTKFYVIKILLKIMNNKKNIFELIQKCVEWGLCKKASFKKNVFQNEILTLYILIMKTLFMFVKLVEYC